VEKKKEENKVFEDRYCQEFYLFIEYEAAEHISDFRKSKSIKPDKVLKTLIDLGLAYEYALKRSDNNGFEAVKDNKYVKLKQERDEYLSRVTINDSNEILKEFKKPLSWSKPLQWYILTGIQQREIFTFAPTSRVSVSVDENEVLIRVSPEANMRECKDAFKLVKYFQKSLYGKNYKGKMKKAKFEEKLKMLNAENEFENP